MGSAYVHEMYVEIDLSFSKFKILVLNGTRCAKYKKELSYFARCKKHERR